MLLGLGLAGSGAIHPGGVFPFQPDCGRRRSQIGRRILAAASLAYCMSVWSVTDILFVDDWKEPASQPSIDVDRATVGLVCIIRETVDSTGSVRADDPMDRWLLLVSFL